MLKKLLIAMTGAALLASSSLSFATTYGPYIGADIGGNVVNATVNDVLGVNTNFSSRGVIGGLFVGYGYNIDRFYIGLEGFFNEASNKSGTKNIDGGLVQRFISQKYGYGLSLMPGIMVLDATFVYLRGGVVRTKFQVSDSGLGVLLLGPTAGTNYATGAQAGIGIQTAMTAALDFRAEYVYSMYNSISNQFGKFSPRSSQINVGIAYKFE